MKKPIQIITVLLAMLVFISPLLSFVSVTEASDLVHNEEVSCCAVGDLSGEENLKSCHSKSSKTMPKDCKDSSCPSNDCHFHQGNNFHIYFPQNSQEKEINSYYFEKITTISYKSLLIQDLSFSFWNPPKYIS